MQESLASKTIKGIFWSGTSQVIRIMFNIGISAILARLLIPEDFGLIGMVTAFSGILGIFSELGLGPAIIQEKDITKEHLSSIFLINIATGFLFSLVMIGLSKSISHFYGENRLTSITIIYGITFIVSAFSVVPQSLLVKQLKFKKLAIIDSISLIISGVLAIFLAFWGMGVWSLVLQSITLILIRVSLLLLYSGWHPNFVFCWYQVKKLFGFSFNLIGFNFINYFNRNLDNIIIGKFLGAEALGYYNRAYTLMLFPLVNISGVFSKVFFPVFSVIKDDISKVGDNYIKANRYISAISFPIMLGLAVVGPEFVQVIYGDNWNRCKFIFRILCLVGMIQSIETTVGWIYLSQGRTDVFLKWELFVASIVIPSFFIGLKWDIEGVSISYAVASYLVTFPNFYVPFRLIKHKLMPFFSSFILTGSLSLVMAGIIFGCRYYLKYFLQASDIFVLISCTSIGIVVYSGLMWIFGRNLLKDIFRLVMQARSNQPNIETK